jgi:SOS-response transcriptional repressor LexA
VNAGFTAQGLDADAGLRGLGLDTGDFVGDMHGAHYCADLALRASAFLRRDDARGICKNAHMTDDRAAYRSFIGYLVRLAGVETPTALADLAGFAPSTVNKVLGDKPVKHKLSSKTIEGLAGAAGLTNVEAHQLLARALQGEALPDPRGLIAGRPGAGASEPSSIRPAEVDVPSISTLPLNLPVMGVAMGGAGDGLYLNGAIVEYVRRPPGLALAPKAFGVYIQGESMTPRYDEGDLVIINPSRPAKAGDHVLIELHPTGFEGEQTEIGPAFVKRLVRRGATEVICEQYNPPSEVRYPTDHVKSIFRIMTNAELFGAG